MQQSNENKFSWMTLYSHSRRIYKKWWNDFTEMININLRAKGIISSVVPSIGLEVIHFCFDTTARILPRSGGQWWPPVIGQSQSKIMITFWWRNSLKVFSVKAKKINYFKSIIILTLTDGILFCYSSWNTAKLFLPELQRCYRIQIEIQTGYHLVGPFGIQQFYFS